MAKIVKDIDEARKLGFTNNNPLNPAGNTGDMVLNIMKEGSKLIEGIKGLQNMKKPQDSQQPQELKPDGRDFITSTPEELDKKAVDFESKKKEEPQMTPQNNPVALTINSKKVEDEIKKLVDKELSEPYRNWTLKDVKNNWGLVKSFLMPKIIEGIKYAIEVKEVKQ